MRIDWRLLSFVYCLGGNMSNSVRLLTKQENSPVRSGSAGRVLSEGWMAALPRSAFDKGFALAALVFFLPFIVLVVTLLVLTDGWPILFAHERVGRHGRPFKCLKFRTMANNANERLAALLASDPVARAEWEANQKLENDPRVTCIGALLRKSSLDELPQFWNVLRGDMALVGPRPIVANEAHHYGEHYAEYLSVKPGVTGLWQVSGRSDTTYSERVALDVDYIRNRPFKRDLGILLRTVGVVLSRSGAK